MSFLISDTFLDRKVGVLLSAAYSKRQVFEEGFSTVRWDNGASSGGWCAPVGVTNNPSNSTATTCGPAAQGVQRIPARPRPSLPTTWPAARTTPPAAAALRPPDNDQDRLGITAALQARPAEGTLLTLDLVYSKLDATRQEDFLEAISFSRSAAQGGKPQTSVVSAEYAANGALLRGVYNGVDVRAESRYDELSTEFTQPTLTWEQDIGASMKLTARVGRAESKFRNPVQTTTTLDALNVNGYGLDFRGNDRLPVITYPFDPTQPGGALTLVTVPQVSSGTQPTTITNTSASEIRFGPRVRTTSTTSPTSTWPGT